MTLKAAALKRGIFDEKLCLILPVELMYDLLLLEEAVLSLNKQYVVTNKIPLWLHTI
ncbi:hypothetical protein [Musicola keenii]|uniref:hypothetical protein n=1 Tax=Musicola keenii TaxID=2884250 RepID=UPI001784FD3B|nr:hypothetical protein [Musicola keenii]